MKYECRFALFILIISFACNVKNIINSTIFSVGRWLIKCVRSSNTFSSCWIIHWMMSWGFVSEKIFKIETVKKLTNAKLRIFNYCEILTQYLTFMNLLSFLLFETYDICIT